MFVISFHFQSTLEGGDHDSSFTNEENGAQVTQWAGGWAEIWMLVCLTPHLVL